jgi:hypothetical protein
MLIKKADVKNHLAAKLRKHHILQGSTSGKFPVSTLQPVLIAPLPPAAAALKNR